MVTHGVPQRSCLGPLLFLIYINDITSFIDEHMLYLYADDTAIITNDQNLDSLNCTLQILATSLEQWCENNRLNINVRKSKVMYFPPGRRHNNGRLKVSINNMLLEQVTKYKYLGYILDSQLSFGFMLNDTINKLNNTLRIFKLIRPTLTTKAAILVFKSKFLSLMEYTLLFSYSMRKKDCKRLQTIQNRFIRCALKLPKRTNVDNHHCSLSILHVDNRKYLNLMSYMYYKTRFSYVEPIAPQRIITTIIKTERKNHFSKTHA